MSDKPLIASDGQQLQAPKVSQLPEGGSVGFPPCFPGCGCAEAAPSSTARVERVRRLVESGIDDPDLFSPDFVNRAPWDLATQRHTNDAKAAFHASRVFSDIQMTVEQASEDGDTVVVRWKLHGTWSGPLPFAPSIPPTGLPVEFTGTYFYRFEGNKIVEKDGEFDIKAASKAILGGLNITCGSDDCVDVVQVLSRTQPPGPRKAES
jgi:predicted ester cyclase